MEKRDHFTDQIYYHSLTPFSIFLSSISINFSSYFSQSKQVELFFFFLFLAVTILDDKNKRLYSIINSFTWIQSTEEIGIEKLYVREPGDYQALTERGTTTRLYR